ncbi:MAG: class I adenylate-forming enzyme family protein [Acidobacteriota bacterium]
MLDVLISSGAVPGRRPAVVTRQGVSSWREIEALLAEFRQEHALLRRRRVGLCFEANASGLAALAALAALQCDAFLIDHRMPLRQSLELCREIRLGALLTPDGQGGIAVHELAGQQPGNGEASVTILTSGSTGKPKAARHTWRSLSRPVRSGRLGEAPCWLLAYRPDLYAGLQVILQCLLDGGTLAVPGPDGDPSAIAELMLKAGVRFASATPSYWRKLLLFADGSLLGRMNLAQATLGGEVVDQQLLDAMKRAFPEARLAHIFATTELGRCFSVSDGRAGFPAAYLQEPLPDGVELRIENGELLARSPNSMQGYDECSSEPSEAEDWVRTGDLVAVKGDRVHFLGRKTDIINVGGNKVHPIEVERVVRSVPGVSDVRVFAKPSSIAGQLVACEVVPGRGEDDEALQKRIVEACRKQLAPHQWPRIIRSTGKMALSGAQKTLRSAPG